MNEDNKKFITVSFVAAGLLVGFTISLILDFLAAHFTLFSRVASSTEMANGIPVVIGAITFAVLQFNRHSVDYMDGVVGELRKVVWPSRRDTGLMTVVVVITLVISGVVVGIYDSIWAYLVNHFVK